MGYFTLTGNLDNQDSVPDEGKIILTPMVLPLYHPSGLMAALGPIYGKVDEGEVVLGPLPANDCTPSFAYQVDILLNSGKEYHFNLVPPVPDLEIDINDALSSSISPVSTSLFNNLLQVVTVLTGNEPRPANAIKVIWDEKRTGDSLTRPVNFDDNDWWAVAGTVTEEPGGGDGTDVTAPSVPTGLTASALTETSFTLSWSASTDEVGVTGYEVRRDGVTQGAAQIGTSKNLTGLTAGTDYDMQVRARDAAGNWSAWSSTLTVTTDSGAVDTLTTLGTAPLVGYTKNSDGGEGSGIAHGYIPSVNGFIDGVRLWQAGGGWATSFGPETPVAAWHKGASLIDKREATLTLSDNEEWVEVTFGSPLPVTAGQQYNAQYRLPFIPSSGAQGYAHKATQFPLDANGIHVTGSSYRADSTPLAANDDDPCTGFPSYGIDILFRAAV